MTEKKWNVEVTREDVMNISKWMTATTMMIEARMRTPYSESEHNTWRKFSISITIVLHLSWRSMG